MKKILFLLLFHFSLTSSQILLNNIWKLQFNDGEDIKLYRGVFTKITIQLSNTQNFNIFNNDDKIYKLSLNENPDIISSEPELIIKPNEQLIYTTYIGLKCKEKTKSDEDEDEYKLKIKTYYSENKDELNFIELGKDIELILEIEDDEVDIELEPLMDKMPSKSVNFFRLKKELYNIDKIEIEAINEESNTVQFDFKDIIIEPYLTRGQLSEENTTNHGILFDYPFGINSEFFSPNTKLKFNLNIKNETLKNYFKIKTKKEIEIRKEGPVKIDEKVKTAVKFNTEDQTSLYQVTNSLKIKTKIPVFPSIFSCEFNPMYLSSEDPSENKYKKYFKTFIRNDLNLDIIINNLETNTEYNAFCELINTDYYEENRQKINLTIGNYEGADIVHQLMPSNDGNRIPQCAKFTFQAIIEDNLKLELFTKLAKNYCYYIIKKNEKLILKPLPTIICQPTEVSAESVTFCVAPLPLYNLGKYLDNKEKEDFNRIFLQFINDVKEFSKFLGISIKKEVGKIFDVEISQSSIRAVYVNETNKDGKLINFRLSSSHSQTIQCYYNNDLNQNCKFSQLKASVILYPNENKIIPVTITSPTLYKMYSLNIKCYNALPNFDFRYKTTGIMSITYFNNRTSDEEELTPKEEDIEEKNKKEIIITNTTINCNDKRNLINPRCLKDGFISISEKLTTDIPTIFKNIENQVQQYSKMVEIQKDNILKSIGNNLISTKKDENFNLTSLYEKVIEFTKYLTYTDCSIFASGSSNIEKETIKKEDYVKCRQNKQEFLENVINKILNDKLQIFNCSFLNETIISKLGKDTELNLKYVLILINELSNNPESYKKGFSQKLFNAAICLQENFDKYWQVIKPELYSKYQLNSSISAIKKDALYIILQTLANLAKIIHYDEIDGYINSAKTKTGLILNETYIQIQKKIIEFSKKLNEFGEEFYPLSGSMLSKIKTYKKSNNTLDNSTEIINLPNKNILIEVYSNYMLKHNNAKFLQILVFDSPLVSIKSSGKSEKTSDSINTFISLILYNEKGEEIPIKSIDKKYRPKILYLKSKYESLKKCYYYNEVKKELETDGVEIDENYEFNGKKYIRCSSSHLTAFTAGTYNFNANIPWWAVLIIVASILFALLAMILIFILVKRKTKSRASYSNINSEFNQQNALLEN